MHLPPPVLKQQVRDLAANQDLKSLQDGAALNAFGNRLPVLKAFQEFLELERAKAQRRLRVTALAFLGVLVAVLVAGGFLLYRLSTRVDREVRQLEQALAVARDETGALRGDAQAMQRALDEAKEALASLQQRAAESAPSATEPAPAATPAFDLAALAERINLVQELQQVRAEMPALSGQLAGLLAEAGQLARRREDIAKQLIDASSSRAALAEQIASFVKREQAAAERLASLQAAAAPPATSKRGMFRRKAESAPETPPDPAPLLAALEELNQLRFEQPALWARQSMLEEEVVSLDREKAALERRETEVKAAADAIMQSLATLESRHTELLAKLDALKPPAR